MDSCGLSACIEVTSGEDEEVTWYADLVLVPIDALASMDSPPPSALRIRAVTFCSRQRAACQSSLTSTEGNGDSHRPPHPLRLRSRLS